MPPPSGLSECFNPIPALRAGLWNATPTGVFESCVTPDIPLARGEAPTSPPARPAGPGSVVYMETAEDPTFIMAPTRPASR